MMNPHRSILRSLLLLLLATASVCSFPQSVAAQKYVLKVVTDPPGAIYEAGQSAKFMITLTRDGQLAGTADVSYVVDDYIAENPPANDYPKGKLTLKNGTGFVTAQFKQPGFLRFRVTFQTPDKKNVTAIAGAAFSPLKIKPSLPVPDDFDAFWDDQKKQLAAVPLDPQLTPVKYNSVKIDCFDVQVQCAGGAPVSGYFARPKDAAAKSLPIVLWVHGAGVRSSNLGSAVKGSQAGMLSMDINAHGLPNGKPVKFYIAQSAGPLENYRHAGRESRETVYFRGMYLRLVRAIDFLTSQPQWDGKTVAVVGHSQGGGQALVAGGIDDRVTFIATGVPAICDHSGRVAGRINGWPKIVPTGTDGKPDATILQATRYVDAVNFASRCKADAIMSVGFIDRTCPPSSCYAAYNSLKGDRTIINEPLMGHAAPQHIRAAFFNAMVKHAKRDADK
jgi:cephalosporin-C deacetylase-like acetyl esterase